MKRILFAVLIMIVVPMAAFAVDGVVLINQSTVMAAGGFPYIISQPGSYKLTGKLTVPAGVNGVAISASNVTLDLNGFSIEGPACAPTFPFCFLFGITVPSPQAGIIVRNGAVLGFLGAIDLDRAGYSLAEDLVVYTNGIAHGTTHFGASNVIRHVISNSPVQLNCPSVVAETIVPDFLTGGSSSCVFTGSSGSVF
ncbi:MAG TPA: hypothetical protein VIW67_21255 [Terriglobales bacterium]|jgi:hypothetical protein